MIFAGLQSVRQVDEDADFQRAPIKSDVRPPPDHEIAPALRGEAEIDVAPDIGPARVTMRADDSPGVEQAAVLRRRPDVEQIDKPEQQQAMSRMDGPEQRQIVAPVPGGHALALRRQGVDTALLRQQRPDARTKSCVGIMRLRRLEDLAKDADQGFLDIPVLVVQSRELLLRGCLRAPDAAQHHLDEFVPAPHARLTHESEQQRASSAELGDVERVAHFHRRGLRGELTQLGMRDAVQQRIGVDQSAEPLQPFHPEPDRLGRRGAGRLFEPVERGRRAPGRLRQQCVQRRRVMAREPCRHPAEDSRVDFRSKPARQPIQGAERRQVDGRGLQSPDRPVDEVGGVTHGFGSLEEGAGQQALGRFAIRHDAEMGPDRSMVAIELAQPAYVISQRGWRLQAELRGDMRHDASMNFARRRKESEIPTGLQQHRQQKAAIVAARVGAHEGQIRLGQVVAKAEFLAAQPRTWPRIGGAVDGCHDASGKGCAASAAGSV